MVVSNIFYFHPYLGKWSNLTIILQMGWNHQLEKVGWKYVGITTDLTDVDGPGRCCIAAFVKEIWARLDLAMKPTICQYSSPMQVGHPRRKLFQPSIFRCELLVSVRVMPLSNWHHRHASASINVMFAMQLLWPGWHDRSSCVFNI